MTKNVVEKAMASITNIIKVMLASPQNKTRLKQITHVISVLFYDTFYLQARVSPLIITLGEIILSKINRQGG